LQAAVGLAPVATSDPGGPTPLQLAQALVGAGVVVSNVTYTGAPEAAGTFTGGEDIIGFEDGIILSTGHVLTVVGPNQAPNATTVHGTDGDEQLNTLSGQTTLDAAVLQFDFVPNDDQIFIEFVFSSEEYNEFVDQGFNDAFAFFVNGSNCARAANNLGVSINTINLSSNSAQYRNNDFGGSTIDTEMDGLTVVLICESSVLPGQTNTMRLAIADAGDASYDSNVFIKGGSLTTIPPNDPPVAVVVPNVIAECSGATTGVALDGSASHDEDGMIVSYQWVRNGMQVGTGANPTIALGLGVHTILLIVTDDRQSADTATVTVTIQDTQAPLLTLNATPANLTPVDQSYRLVGTPATAADACGGPLTVTGTVVSSEPDNAPARTGTTTGDIRVTRPDNSVLLSSVAAPAVAFNPLTDQLEVRAERRGASADRVYTITFNVRDARNNAREVTATVRVPRD
jgi:hypothetical protein